MTGERITAAATVGWQSTGERDELLGPFQPKALHDSMYGRGLWVGLSGARWPEVIEADGVQRSNA